MSEVFKELNYNNELIFLTDSVNALAYLTDTEIKPFLILSDINMPKLNGMELREKIHNNEDLRLKSIPYLFFSTSGEQKHVIDAYSRSVQGFLSNQVIMINYYPANETPINFPIPKVMAAESNQMSPA